MRSQTGFRRHELIAARFAADVADHVGLAAGQQPENDRAQLIERIEDILNKGLKVLDSLQNLNTGC